MITGAQRAEAEPEGVAQDNGSNAWLGSADEVYEPAVPIESEMSGGLKALAVLLGLAAFAWLAFAVWSLIPTFRQPTLPGIVTSVALVSGPLILLALIWLIFGKTTRRETQRFRAVVAEMHRESVALQSILQIVATQLEDNHARLTGEAAKLMKLGDEAADRLGRVTHYISKETVTLDRKAEQLEAAANAARVDIGVLLTDLPKAEEQARTVAEAMKQAGLAALGEAGQLESQLSALVARGREADEVVGGTAQRLAAHLQRIETSTAAAKVQLDDATQSMTSAVDESLVRTSEAVAAARSSLQAQGEAMLAMIEQSRVALETAGEASGRSLAQRLEQVSGQIEQLASQLAAQDAASQTLVSGLSSNLAELDQRFVALGATGGTQNEQLGSSIELLRSRVQELQNEVTGGQDRAAELIGRAEEMARALTGITSQLQSDIPSALSEVEAQAGRTKRAAEELAPVVEAVQVAACDAASQAAAAEASIARQKEALDTLLARLRENVAGAEEQLRALGQAAEGADAAAARIGGETGPQLIDALVRVRETANQAANHARETISAVIPGAAAEIGEASRRAIGEAIAETFRTQVEELSALSERATETARAASERLTRQMLAIGDSAAAVEARIEEERRAEEATSSEAFSRRVSLLIEALNSTAIDVTKILSNEVTDAEWAAYLKGDRGVFTRRAVRLLDNSEAREVGQYYEMDAEFREQVNRYIADFETMLRRVLADRDGNALGVTILSSDMGKLYVALAQAIERLRN
ncbi:MAG TPA: hypothetical protein VGD10_10080 [Allosphingosinicella sp.]|uniref:hypothetical protein n=1 Tax=Allosphingosinicella sp. TaxID=2823234 RepID=UPI002EDA0A7D